MTKDNQVAIVRRNNTLPVMRPEAEENYIVPSADVYETPDAFVLLIDMPGVTKEAVNVWIDRGSLVVKGATGRFHGENARLLVRELRGTGYYRVFNLGDGIDRDTIDAQFENGVLSIRLFKNEELRPREIKIK